MAYNTSATAKVVYAVKRRLREYAALRGTQKVDWAARLTPTLDVLRANSDKHTKKDINRIIDAVYTCREFLERDIYKEDAVRYFWYHIMEELIARALNPYRLLRIHGGDYDVVATILKEF